MTSPSNQGAWAQPLVGELSYHMPREPKNKNIRQKQYCNKFNKDLLKMVHIKKKIFKNITSGEKYNQ